MHVVRLFPGVFSVCFFLVVACYLTRRLKAVRLVLFSVAAAFVLLLGGSRVILAQSVIPDPNFEAGTKPFGSYHGGNIDNIILLNGANNIDIPLVSYPQRGKLKLDFVLHYVSTQWYADQVCPLGPPCTYSGPSQLIQSFGPIRAGLPVWGNLVASTGASCTSPLAGTFYMECNATIAMSDGSTRPLWATGPTTFVAVDGSGYRLDSSSIVGLPIVTDAEGTRYLVPSGGTTITEDTNGNQIVADPKSSTLTDTVGRVIPAWSTMASTTDYSGCTGPLPINSATIWNLPGVNGGVYPLKFCYVQVSETLPVQVIMNEIQNLPQTYNAVLLQSVVLPNNGAWTFQYTTDGYGDLAQIAFPTGGTLSYTWTSPSAIDPGTHGILLSRAVQTRTLTPNDGTSPAGTWKYSYTRKLANSGGGGAGSTTTTVVTDPAQNDTVHTFTDLGYFAYYETLTQSYQGTSTNGTLLKSDKTDYSYTGSYSDPTTSQIYPAQNVLPIRVTTTLPNGLQSKVEYGYDSAPTVFLAGYQANGTTPPTYTYLSPVDSHSGSYGRLTVKREYGFASGAPGALIRTTSTSYQAFSNANYLNNNLLTSPSSVLITDGTNNQVASTSYGYDETALAPSGVTSRHDSNPSAGSARGNLTSASQWLNTGGSIVSRVSWLDTGEVSSETDPLGHVTTHNYDSAYAGALRTKTCNALSQCVSGTYDFNTGLQTSFTNANATTQASGNTPGDSAHTTTAQYNDPLWRPTLIQSPADPSGNNAVTTIKYPNANTVERLKSITSTLTDDAFSYFDGLGRHYKAVHVTAGNATVVSTFDGLGRAATVTNPYFSTSDPTYGITQSQYDALGRVTQVTKQDGSVRKIRYSVTSGMARNGDCSITTDEAGQQRGICTDALGRLIEVDEPPASGVVAANYHATMQTDGNFVLYNSANASQWSTGTSGTNAQSIMMQDDGNLVLYMFKWSAGVYAAGSPGPFPPSTCSIGTYLIAGQTLPSGKCIASPDGQYFLYMDVNGNLYIYDWAHATGTWGPGTAGHPGAYATLQMDGNFVVYDVNGVALWSSGTGGTYAERLDMENDGRIIIYRSAWSSLTSNGQFNGSQLPHPGCDVGTGTGWTGVLGSGQCFVSPNGHFELLLQADGNMVIYDLSVTPNVARWSSDTAVSQVDPSVAMRTFYTYDALGNLTCAEQHGNATSGTGCSASPSSDATSPWRVRRFSYDSLSRLLTATNPESGTITYAYDADGNLLQKTSPAANPNPPQPTQIVSYCYDALNRVTGKGYGTQSCPQASPVVTYVYDSGANAVGKMVSMTDQAGTANYGYDVLGQLTTETRTLMGSNPTAISQTMRYEYNLDGSLKTLHYPSGAAVAYTPDSAGRMLTAVDNANSINYVTGATYGPDSSLTGFVSGNSGTFAGITNAFSYNKRLQPLTMSATAPSQTVFSIGYDFHLGNGTTGSDNGNVWSITNYKDTTRNQTFTYDALNRLTSAQNAGTDCTKTLPGGKTEYWGNSYGYDAWGNLTNKTVTKCGAENLSVTALVNNQLSGYGYDAAGNMISDPTDNVTPRFDQENRITGANGYTYTYDGDGNRVSKSNGTTGTLYWYLTPGVVAETDLVGALKSEYVFFDGERVARKDFPGNTIAYYFSDHLKTASVITDSAGNIMAESDYYPWGGELQFINNDSNDYKFTGKKRDTETGLDYFGARYYSNGLGRFITPDWAAKPAAVPYAVLDDPQSLNLYTYVRNIPTTRFDADGHCAGDPKGPQCSDVKVTAQVDQKPKFEKNVKIKGVDGKVVAKATGVSGQLIDTVTVKGKPQSDVKVTEQNEETHTVNGKQITNKLVEGKGSTNELGQIGDMIGTFNPTSGTKEDNKAIVQALSSDAHTITDKQTLTLTLSNGCTCSATSTRTLTNVGPDGKGSEHYTLTTTQPVVTTPNQ